MNVHENMQMTNVLFVSPADGHIHPATFNMMYIWKGTISVSSGHDICQLVNI